MSLGQACMALHTSKSFKSTSSLRVKNMMEDIILIMDFNEYHLGLFYI